MKDMKKKNASPDEMLDLELEIDEAKKQVDKLKAMEKAEKEKAKAAKALTEVQKVKAVSIEGHPRATYNGVYTHDSTHEGWPVLKSDSGRYCYRHTPRDAWYRRGKVTPDEDLCAASIVAKGGPLPVGGGSGGVGGPTTTPHPRITSARSPGMPWQAGRRGSRDMRSGEGGGKSGAPTLARPISR